MRTRLRPFLQPLRWLLSLALLGLVARLLWQHGSAWAERGIAIDGRWLALASAMLAFYYLLGCALWRRWLMALGHPLPYAVAFRVLYLANLAKYVPGGAWNYVDRTVRLGRYGVPAIAGSLATLIDVVCAVAAAQLVAALALAGSLWPGGGWVLALSLGAVLVGLHPRALNRVMAVAGGLLRRESPPVPYSYRFLLGMFLGYVASWLLLGAAFAVFAASLVPDAWPRVIELAGAFSLSWAVGTIAFVFPAGLGVREATLVGLLTPFLPAAWPPLLALAARLWFLVADVVFFGAALLIPEHVPPRRVPLPRGTSDDSR
jgi:hypothetical protein